MENKIQNQITDGPVKEPEKKENFLPSSILIAALILAGTWIYTTNPNYQGEQSQIQLQADKQAVGFEEMVLPTQGVVLPVSFGDLGGKMIQEGVINREKLEALYLGRGGLSDEEIKFLEGDQKENIRITQKNSGFLLNLFWAIGLSAKNDILEKGPMADPKYGGAENFASTGGWTLSTGDAMNHYSRHQFIVLNAKQQSLVESVSKNIYRPCCGNPTHFPDCNHGMAMLGLLELMASQNVSEEEMYKVALVVNSYWFPDTYIAIAQYLESKGVSWDQANPKEILGYDYSSASGYRNILSQITPQEKRSGGGCGV